MLLLLAISVNRTRIYILYTQAMYMYACMYMYRHTHTHTPPHKHTKPCVHTVKLQFNTTNFNFTCPFSLFVILFFFYSGSQYSKHYNNFFDSLRLSKMKIHAALLHITNSSTKELLTKDLFPLNSWNVLFLDIEFWIEDFSPGILRCNFIVYLLITIERQK